MTCMDAVGRVEYAVYTWSYSFVALPSLAVYLRLIYLAFLFKALPMPTYYSLHFLFAGW